MNPIEHLWRDLKIAVQQHSQSNLTELERICREECEKFPKYTCRCAKLVESYPRRLEALMVAKGASAKYKEILDENLLQSSQDLRLGAKVHLPTGQ